MGFADGQNLTDVMPAVDELKFSPLVEAERAKEHVAGATGGGAEDILGFGAELVEVGKTFGGGVGELFAGEWVRVR